MENSQLAWQPVCPSLFQAREVFNERAIEKSLRRFLAIFRSGAVSANLRQFSAIEPHAAALGAFIHEHCFLGREFVFHQDNVDALGTISTRILDLYLGIEFQRDQGGTERLVRLVHLVQLEVIEPDAAAAAATRIHNQSFDRDGDKITPARRTNHTPERSRAEKQSQCGAER